MSDEPEPVPVLARMGVCYARGCDATGNYVIVWETSHAVCCRKHAVEHLGDDFVAAYDRIADEADRHNRSV